MTTFAYLFAVSENLRQILEPGQVTELRALNCTRPGCTFTVTMSGYFDDPDVLATEAARTSAACGTGRLRCSW